MANKQKMRSTLLLTIAMFVSCLLLCFTMNVGFAKKASADGDIFANQEIQIRLKTQDSEICGIRFTITVDAAEAASLVDPEYGVLVAKTNDLNGQALNFDLENVETIASKVPAQVFAEESDTAIVYQVVINGIPESDYGTKITAVPYAIDGETVIVADQGQSYAIAEVANILINNGSNDSGLLEYIDGVLKTGEFTVPESIELNKGEDKELECIVSPEYLTPSYSTDDDSIVTVNEQGVVTAVGIGTANVTVKVGSSEKVVAVKVNPTKVENPGMVYDYNDSFATSDTTNQYKEFLPTYQGATGVTHINLKNASNVWHSSKITPVHSQSYYAKHDTIVFRMQQDMSDKCIDYILENATGGTTNLKNDVTLTDIGSYVWIELELKASTFINNFESFTKKTFYAYSNLRELWFDAILAFNRVNVTSNVENVFVGVPYTISDNAVEAFDAVNVELYDFKQTVLLNGVEVTLENGTFTPDQAGRVEVIYTAVDEEGVLYRARYYYDIDEPGMVLNFANKTRDRNQSGIDVAITTYLEEFEGVNGVTHVQYQAGYTRGYLWNFKYAPFTSTYYDYYDTICVKYYGKSSTTTHFALHARNLNKKLSGIYKENYKNEWVEQTRTVENQLQTTKPSTIIQDLRVKGIDLYIVDKPTGTTVSEIYLNKVYMAKAMTVTPSVTSGSVGSAITLTDDATTVMSGMNISYEVTYKGLDVEVSNGVFTPSEAGTYTVIVKGVDSLGRLHRGEYKITVA